MSTAYVPTHPAYLPLQQCTEDRDVAGTRSQCSCYSDIAQLVLRTARLGALYPHARSSGGPGARYHSLTASASKLCELVQQVSMSSGTSTPLAAHSSILMQDLNGCGSCGYCYTRAVQSKDAVQYRELLCLLFNPVVGRRQSPPARESR